VIQKRIIERVRAKPKMAMQDLEMASEDSLSGMNGRDSRFRARILGDSLEVD
jgi:hypothetical protein